MIHYSVFLFPHYVLLNILFSIQVMYKKDNISVLVCEKEGVRRGGDERIQRSYAVYL